MDMPHSAGPLGLVNTCCVVAHGVGRAGWPLFPPYACGFLTRRSVLLNPAAGVPVFPQAG